MSKLSFSVDRVSELQDSEDKNFSNVQLDLFASGDNEHHLIVSEDTLRACAASVYNMPIVWRYDFLTDDADGHHPEEVPCGFVFENNNPLQFKQTRDGRIMLSLFGKIWKRYSGKLMEIFKKSGGEKAVSVEIDVNEYDENNSEIKSFSFNAVTLLGRTITPAIPDAKALILSFSKDRDSYYNTFSSKPKFTIDNSVESAFMDETKPTSGRSLYSKIIDQPNAEYFAKEIYLDADTKWFENPSKSLSPHHKWRGNVLCLSRVGLEQEMAKLQAGNITAGESYEHLRRHFSELGMEDVFSKNFEKKEEETLEEKVMMEEAKEEVVATPEQEAKEEEKPEAEEEKKEEVDYAAKIMDYEAKLQEYACGVEKYEAELGELRKFKADREEQDRLFQVEKLFSEVGDSLPKEKAEEFREEAKSLQFSEIAAFSNKVKACTFEVIKNTGADSGVKRMAVATPEKVEKKSVWGF